MASPVKNWLEASNSQARLASPLSEKLFNTRSAANKANAMGRDLYNACGMLSWRRKLCFPGGGNKISPPQKRQ